MSRNIWALHFACCLLEFYISEAQMVKGHVSSEVDDSRLEPLPE